MWREKIYLIKRWHQNVEFFVSLELKKWFEKWEIKEVIKIEAEKKGIGTDINKLRKRKVIKTWD